MKTARRTKTLALTGLLAVLTLTATGCSPQAPAGEGPGAPAPASASAEPVAQTKIADIIPAGFVEAPSFYPAGVPTEWHFTPADVGEIKKVGVAALQIMLEDHPEFTVEGFKPTPEIWTEQVAPKLQPISTPKGFERMSAAWGNVLTEDVTFTEGDGLVFTSNPVLTNSPEILDNSNYPTYTASSTWKSDSGEVCSPSDKPYAIKPNAIILDSWTSDGEYLNALVGAQYDVVIRCKEGGQLTSRMDHQVVLERSGSQFLVGQTSLMKTPGGTSVMTK